ncbi:protein 5NUC-like isoform X2 [Ornithodoros turicata]|uniref:protein 5NUC-like isoform X2 n=1 Tax=Ornithodoros turicata TaxID=34597 RepID=UPI00313970AA
MRRFLYCTVFFNMLCRTGSADFIDLTILHSNDIHAHVTETDPQGMRCGTSTDCVGGVDRQLYMVRKIRSMIKDKGNMNGHVLFLNAGDNYQGTAWYSVLKYKPVANIVELLRPDAMTLGNHEFDDGPEGLAPFLQQIKGKVPVIASNVDFSRAPSLKGLVSKSTVVNLNGTKVGIIGAVTTETSTISYPGPVTFDDHIECVRAEAKRLRGAGIKIQIALTHIGYLRDQELAHQVPELTVIVGGHSHTFLYTGNDHPKEDAPEGPYPTVITRDDGTKALVAQGFWFGKYLGRLNVMYDLNGNMRNWSGKPILLDNNVPQEPEMSSLLQRYQDNVTAGSKQIVGSSKVLLQGDPQDCLFKECTMGNLITDAMFSFIADKPTAGTGVWSVVDACVLNSGAITGSLLPNVSITRGDLWKVTPFHDTLTTVTLKGTALRSIFEFSASKYSENSTGRGAGFVQVSGGGGYDFGDAMAAQDNGDLLHDALEKFFRRRSPVIARLEGRIRIVHIEDNVDAQPFRSVSTTHQPRSLSFLLLLTWCWILHRLELYGCHRATVVQEL